MRAFDPAIHHRWAAGPQLICCLAWGLDTMRIPAEWLPALETNRMLILEMQDSGGDRAAAEARNRFVLHVADRHWLVHVGPGGMLARFTRPCIGRDPGA